MMNSGKNTAAALTLAMMTTLVEETKAAHWGWNKGGSGEANLANGFQIAVGVIGLACVASCCVGAGYALKNAISSRFFSESPTATSAAEEGRATQPVQESSPLMP